METPEVKVYDFYDPSKSDSEIIRTALAFVAPFPARTLVFDQKDWYIDEAILLPSHTRVIIDDCMIKQRDYVFDNVFRGDNFVVNEEDPYGDPLSMDPIENIVIQGKNNAGIAGCDHNRTGYHPVLKEEKEMTGDFWGWSQCPGRMPPLHHRTHHRKHQR